jgi:BRCT domain type II-containing protein
MGPAKLQKAQKLGIRILSEKEFIEMVADTPTLPIVEEPTNTALAQESTPVKEQVVVQGSLF